MPIIYTYPSATPTTNDLLVFSDVSATDPAKDTRKCTIGDLVSLVGDLVPGGGTVTDITLDFGTTGLLVGGESEEEISTSGTFTVTGVLDTANGGTGTSSDLTGVLKGGGAGEAFSASDVDLTSEVTGVLPEANGGTGESTYTKGDILYCSATGANLDKLTIGADGTLLKVATDVPAWTTATAAGLVTSVQVSGGSTGLAFTGGPITTTGTITLASGQLVVANGGTGAATLTDGGILLGSGTSPITVTAQPTNGQILIGSTGNDPVLSTLTQGTGVTITNTAGGIEIASAVGGGGIYGGSGSLSGATVITTGANDLTFTATTGDIIFNNNIGAANPAFFIDGATSTVGMGGNANLTDQCSIYNKTGSGNTISLGIQGNNTTGNQGGIHINVSGASTKNVGLEVNASSATTNHAIVTDGGNSGFGTTSPDASALVEVNSTTQGLLLPVMTTAQKNAISAPAEGLMVYDVTLHKLCIRVAAAWETVTSA